MDEVSLWEAVLEVILRPPLRKPLSHVASLNDVIHLIKKSQKIIVLSGAGVSKTQTHPYTLPWLPWLHVYWFRFRYHVVFRTFVHLMVCTLS